MSCRLLHFGGRPGFFPLGSSGASTAHWVSVSSNRLVTATLATRSPCRWSSWSKTHLPETSPYIDQRHAELVKSTDPPPTTYDTRPSSTGRRMATIFASQYPWSLLI